MSIDILNYIKKLEIKSIMISWGSLWFVSCFRDEYLTMSDGGELIILLPLLLECWGGWGGTMQTDDDDDDDDFIFLSVS